MNKTKVLHHVLNQSDYKSDINRVCIDCNKEFAYRTDRSHRNHTCVRINRHNNNIVVNFNDVKKYLPLPTKKTFKQFWLNQEQVVRVHPAKNICKCDSEILCSLRCITSENRSRKITPQKSAFL